MNRHPRKFLGQLYAKDSDCNFSTCTIQISLELTEPEALADFLRRGSASLDISYVCYCMSSALAKQSRGRFFSNFAGLAHNAPYPIDARRR